MTKRFGFTLAEVLITLGIIGVVAAMTIPTLIANTNGAKYRSQFKKTLSFCAILNGTLTGQTYQGKVTNITRQTTNADGTTSATAYSIQNQAQGAIDAAYGDYLAYTLADGSIVAFNAGAVSCELPIGQQMNSTWIDSHPLCRGFIDVNGATLPNKAVTCTPNAAGSGAGATASTAVEDPCIVKNNAQNMTDVFPIVFHDATVEPASDAAKYVLTSAK